MAETRLRPTVGVTIGDPAGIGPEVVVRALAEDAARQSVDVVVIGDRWVLQRAMGATGVGIEFVAEGSPRLIDLANVDHRLQWGKVQATAGAAAGQFIERAVQEALAGRVDALATAPISKEALWRAGYRYPGHTEMLGALTGRPARLASSARASPSPRSTRTPARVGRWAWRTRSRSRPRWRRRGPAASTSTVLSRRTRCSRRRWKGAMMPSSRSITTRGTLPRRRWTSTARSA